jgi:hypothetical protein
MDDKYALFPYDISSKDMTYAVLGLYTIAHAWGKSLGFPPLPTPNELIQPAEYQPASNDSGRVVRYKFAFRWCDKQVAISLFFFPSLSTLTLICTGQRMVDFWV